MNPSKQQLEAVLVWIGGILLAISLLSAHARTPGTQNPLPRHSSFVRSESLLWAWDDGENKRWGAAETSLTKSDRWKLLPNKSLWKRDESQQASSGREMAEVAPKTSKLILRGGGSGVGPGRRTKPQKVPREFWKKTYSPTWHKLRLRKTPIDYTKDKQGDPIEKEEPGNYWATGFQHVDLAPGLTVGREIPYELAFLKRQNYLFHPDTMEPFNRKRIFMTDDADMWQELRWDPRDLDENVTRMMLNAEEEHPWLKWMVDEMKKQEDARALASAHTLQWLSDQHCAQSKAQRKRKLPRSAVTPACTNISKIIVAASHRGAALFHSDDPVPVLCQTGSYSWEGENGYNLLGLKQGRFSVSAEDWDPNIAITDSYDQHGVEVKGCWWLHEKTSGQLQRLRMVHSQCEVDDEDLEGEPLSCVTVCGSTWALDTCSVYGGGREVVSVRWEAQVTLFRCVLGDTPPDEAHDPMVHPQYCLNDEVHNRTVPWYGVGRTVDGVMSFDSARVRIEACLMSDSLFGGYRAYDDSVGVVSNCTFANLQIGVEAANASRVAVDTSDFEWCLAAFMAHGDSSLLAEDCRVQHNMLGLSIHNNATAVIRRSNFAECVDGAFFAGEDKPNQKLELRNNTVLCHVFEGMGYAWLSVERPGTLIDKGNRVFNDEYYPKSKDVIGENAMSIPELLKWEEKFEEEHLGPDTSKDSWLVKHLKILIGNKKIPNTRQRKTAEEKDLTDRVATAPLVL